MLQKVCSKTIFSKKNAPKKYLCTKNICSKKDAPKKDAPKTHRHLKDLDILMRKPSYTQQKNLTVQPQLDRMVGTQ